MIKAEAYQKAFGLLLTTDLHLGNGGLRITGGFPKIRFYEAESPRLTAAPAPGMIPAPWGL